MERKQMITGWKLLGRIFMVYGIAALAVGLATLFVLAFLARPGEMSIAVAGAGAGVAMNHILRFLTTHWDKVRNLVCWPDRLVPGP